MVRCILQRRCERSMIRGGINSVRNRYLNSDTCCSLSLHRQKIVFNRTCFDVHYNIRIAEAHCVNPPLPPPPSPLLFAFDPVFLAVLLVVFLAVPYPLYIRFFSFYSGCDKTHSFAMETFHLLGPFIPQD